MTSIDWEIKELKNAIEAHAKLREGALAAGKPKDVAYHSACIEWRQLRIKELKERT